MKYIIVIILQFVFPVFVHAVTDDEMILSKKDAQNMFSMAKEDWIQNVKDAKTAGITFPCQDKDNLSLCIDTGVALLATSPDYMPGEIYPYVLYVVIQYKTPNFLTKNQFENVVETSKKEMSPEYDVEGTWNTRPDEIYTTVTFVITENTKKNIEKRVIAYADDGLAAWFTFEYNSKDIFTLSFAGSGSLRGVLIAKGRILNDKNTLCILETEDPNKKLQNLIEVVFIPKYGFAGSVDVDPKNTIGLVKGKISNTILYYFLKLAQDSENTKSYLKALGCEPRN